MSSDHLAYQIQTKASSKIPVSSYNFVFVCFKDTLNKNKKISRSQSFNVHSEELMKDRKEMYYSNRSRTLSEQAGNNNKVEKKRKRGQSWSHIEECSEDLKKISTKRTKTEENVKNIKDNKKNVKRLPTKVKKNIEETDMGNESPQQANEKTKIPRDFTEFCEKLNELIKESNDDAVEETGLGNIDKNQENTTDRKCLSSTVCEKDEDINIHKNQEKNADIECVLSSTVCEEKEEVNVDKNQEHVTESKYVLSPTISEKNDEIECKTLNEEKEKDSNVNEQEHYSEKETNKEEMCEDHYPLKKRPLRTERDNSLSSDDKVGRLIDEIETELDAIFRDDLEETSEEVQITSEIVNNESTEKKYRNRNEEIKNGEKDLRQTGENFDETVNKDEVDVQETDETLKDKRETLLTPISEESPNKERPKLVNIISNTLLSPAAETSRIHERKNKRCKRSEETEEMFEGNKSDDEIMMKMCSIFDEKEKKKKCKQKSIKEYFLKRNNDNVSESEVTENSEQEEDEETKDKSLSSHFSLHSQEDTCKRKEHNRQTKSRDRNSKLRRKLINKVSEKVDKILSKDKHIGASYGVDVSVKIKKIGKRRRTDEELSVQYRKSARCKENDEENTQEEMQTNDDLSQDFGCSVSGNLSQGVMRNEMLDNLKINLPWPVPPLHNVEKWVAKAPTIEEKSKIKSLNVKIKTGSFSKLEDDQIKKNFEELCQTHNLPTDPAPFLNFSGLKGVHFPREERVNFVRFLGHGLEDRILFSIYMRFQRLYTKLKIKTGRFTKEEDEIIKKFMEHPDSKTPFSHLSKVLNRERSAVMRRYKKLLEVDQNEKTKTKWNQERVEEFLKNLLEVTGCTNIEALRDREITSEEWKRMSKKMNIPDQYLRQVWLIKIYVRLFIEESLNTGEIKKKVLELLSKEEKNWNDVNWNEISKEFKGLTGPYLKTLFKAMVKHQVPKEKQENLKDCLKNLEDDNCVRRCRSLIKLDLDESILPSDSQCDESESTI